MLELATLNREMPIVAPCRLIGSKSDTAMRHFKLFCFPWTAGQRESHSLCSAFNKRPTLNTLSQLWTQVRDLEIANLLIS